MPIICVEIEYNTDTGEAKVGQCEPSEMAEESTLQPAESLDAAFEQARKILSQGGSGQESQKSQGEAVLEQLQRGYDGPARRGM